MNKKELIDKIAENAGLQKNQAESAISQFIEIVSNSLANGEDVNLPGFGGFVVKHRAARQGRNPQTGEAISIEASKSPGFKASSVLKKKVKS